MFFNTQYEHPARLLLSVMWALAAVLAAAAFAASALAAPRASPVAPTLHPMRLASLAPAKSVESVTSSSMLREPRLAISKDKLD